MTLSQTITAAVRARYADMSPSEIEWQISLAMASIKKDLNDEGEAQ